MEHGHLVEVPKKFELSGNNVIEDFARIVTDINYLMRNHTLTYRIKVDAPKITKKKNLKKMQFEHQKSNSKHANKFNVPLNRKNMKLSAYEMLMKKMAEIDEPSQVNVVRTVQMPTTAAQIQVMTTKQTPLGKYRPIIHKYKTNYTKRVRPVRNDVITLITHEFRHAA